MNIYEEEKFFVIKTKNTDWISLMVVTSEFDYGLKTEPNIYS